MILLRISPPLSSEATRGLVLADRRGGPLSPPPPQNATAGDGIAGVMEMAMRSMPCEIGAPVVEIEDLT